MTGVCGAEDGPDGGFDAVAEAEVGFVEDVVPRYGTESFGGGAKPCF